MKKLIGLMAVFSLMACNSNNIVGGSSGDSNTNAGFVEPPITTPSEVDYERAMNSNSDQASRDALIDKLPTIEIDDDGTPRTRYIWDGDMLLTKEQVNAQMIDTSAQPANNESAELRVMVDRRGRAAFWPRNQRDLAYWIDRNSFPSREKYQLARAAMQGAANDWVEACSSCGISIRETSSPSQSLFKVRYEIRKVPFIAAAFFPNDPPYRRVVYIADGFYKTGFNKTGVLRHELGHVLGYRHEHIVGIRGCRMEDNQWKPLTQYDPKSVMHYFCGGGGTRSLELSNTDKQGHRNLYSR